MGTDPLPGATVAAAPLGLLGLALLLALAGPSGPPTAAGEGEAASVAAARRFYAWWDTLPYPPLGAAPFVRFPSERVPDGDLSGLEHGFLVAERPGRALVLTTDLHVLPLPAGRGAPGAPGTPGAPEAAGAPEPADLERYVRRGLDALARVPEGTAWFDRPDPFGAHRWEVPDQSFRLAVLARACDARGLGDLAQRLWEQARRELHRGREAAEPQAALRAFQEGVAEEAAEAFDSRLADPGTPWTELAAHARALARALRWESSDLADALEAQAAVAARNAARAPWAQLRPEERVLDAIARLQEVTEPILRDDPSPAEGPPGADPIRALRELGEAAVPALIEALPDRRLTRAVYVLLTDGRAQFRTGTTVARVGEVARSLLRRIAVDEGLAEDLGGLLDEDGGASADGADDPGSHDPGSHDPGSHDPGSQDPGAAAQRLREAWARAASRDRVAAARRVIASAREGCGPRARWLAARDPEGAVAAIAEGLRASPGSWASLELVRALARVPGAAALALLRRHLAEAPSLRDRFAAAWALAERGERDGIRPMARAWRESTDEQLWEASEEVGDLPAFLADAGDLEALRALADGLSLRRAEQRHRVVCALLPPAQRPGASDDATRCPWPPAAAGAAPSAPAAEVVHALLGGRLEDADAVRPFAPWARRHPLLDRRIAHAAAQVLALRHPDRYRFPLGPHGAGRARALALAQNTFRAARGLPALAVPPEPPVAGPVDAARFAPLLERALAAGPAERAPALEALAALGRGAVAPLGARLAALDRRHPAYAPLAELAARLSSTVCDVRVHEPEGVSAQALRAHVEGLLGAPLEGRRFVGVLTQAVQALPPAAGGVRVRAERAAGSSGIVLEVTLLPGGGGAPGGLQGWQVSPFEVHAGRWGRSAVGGGAWLSPSRAQEGWPVEAWNLDEALAEPPEGEFVAEVTLTRAGS